MMREDLRAATLGTAQKFQNEVVTVNGAKIEVRQPHVRARSAIMKAAKALSGDKDKVELDALQVTAVIQCCFDPETGQPVFEAADYDALANVPSGGFVDQLSEVALKLLNVSPETIAGNSARTPSDNSSSP